MLPSELLDIPEKWTQQATSRDSMQRVVHPNDPDACCWCIVGAISRCTPIEREHNELIKRVSLSVGCLSATAWNDDAVRTFDEVRAALIAVGL